MFEYSIVGSVTTLPAFYLQVFMDLDETKTTVVREIAAEDLGGVVGLKMRGAVNLSFTSRVFAEVELYAPKDVNFLLWGPSCVPSPPFAEIGQITFSLTEAGFKAPPGGTLSVQSVGGGGHVYVDQIS